LRRSTCIPRRIANLLLALWTGSLVTVCALVAPTLFALLERPLAGRVAARLFFAEAAIGVCATIGIFALQRLGGFVLSRAAVAAILIAALAPLASELFLTPIMQATREAGDMARFGALHGVSAVLFVSACVSAVAAVWLFNRPAT
jgi:hypothetical protein